MLPRGTNLKWAIMNIIQQKCVKNFRFVNEFRKKNKKNKLIILKKLQCSTAVINKLIEKGVLLKCEMEVPADPFDHLVSERKRDVKLSQEQTDVIENIEKHFDSFACFDSYC